MSRQPIDFNSFPAEEQSWYLEDSWCGNCNQPDLGILNPRAYVEGGKTYIAGDCKVCGSECVTEIIETEE